MHLHVYVPSTRRIAVSVPEYHNSQYIDSSTYIKSRYQVVQ